MKSLEIRQKFFDFFIKRKHEKVASSSLIPAQDPTLLFANAGMNQFKDVFLGKENRSYKRAVTIQKCMRAGGKHNDLDNVGFTKRHLTFFEMMGNFSFGDYFKEEAIEFAWDFITKEMKIDASNLHATVFTTDDESYNIWHKTVGIPENRMHRLGAKENFWQMGDTGPCGPCTEIHLDRGPAFGCKEQCSPACDCDRFLEIWNLVFMQFDRQPDGTDVPLKQTGVDTGMGLERLCAVVQNVDSVYGTDLFANIIKAIEKETGLTYAKQDAQTQAAFHVLCDHIRASTMLIGDGCAPSNEGRGYVLRKIIRRAALFAQKLTDKNIFPDLSAVVVQDMGTIYPDIVSNKTLIHKVLSSEVEKFSANLVRGQHLLSKIFVEDAKNKVVTGAQTFKLYDTFGFPVELTKLIAHEKGFGVDEEGFKAEMAQQQAQSGKKDETATVHVALDENIETEFTGYKELETTSHVIALIEDNKVVNEVPAGADCWVIAKKSPFFIVGGGQVPDKGWVTINGKKITFKAVDYINNAIGVHIEAPANIKVGDAIVSTVNKELRITAMKNHTATHLLQAALMQILGKTIKQSGSLVAPDYLRFDFTYPENLSPHDTKRVEDLVNEKIRENIEVKIEYMTLSEATKKGALAFFGDKYNPEKVRMVCINNFSTELCGGTHVHRTGDIGAFKITEITALSAGHRRIVAVTGPKAIDLFQECFDITKNLSNEFKVKREEIVDAVLKQKEQLKHLHTSIKQLKKQLWQSKIPVWSKDTETINGVPYGFVEVEGYSAEDLKEIASALEHQKSGLYVVINAEGDRTTFYTQVSPTYSSKVNLQKFATWLKEAHGIKGGGKENNLQGGGGKFDAKLKEGIKSWLAQQ